MNPKRALSCLPVLRTAPLKKSLGAFAHAFFACSLLVACGKDGATGPDAASDRGSLLAGKEWTLTAMVSEPGYRNERGELVTDLLAGDPESCIDVFPIRFEVGGRFPATSIESKCGDPGASRPPGSWSLKSGGSLLVIDFDGEIPPVEYEIESLEEKTLKLSLEIPAMGDMPARRIIQTYTGK